MRAMTPFMLVAGSDRDDGRRLGKTRPEVAFSLPVPLRDEHWGRSMVKEMAGGLVIALLAYTGAASAGSVCDRIQSAGATPASLLTELSKSLTKIADENGYVAYVDTPKTAVWTFTKPGHEAHPSVVCRSVIANSDGSNSINMKVFCIGTDAACDKLVATSTGSTDAS